MRPEVSGTADALAGASETKQRRQAQYKRGYQILNTPRVPSVFISAVSRELGTVRQLVKKALEDSGYHAVEQANFPLDYRDVVDKLRNLMASCDAVIPIAGQCFGAAPPQQREGTTRRSYTQLEYALARQLGKPVYVFITDDAFPTDPHAAEEEEHSRLQAAHRQTLIQTGRDYCRAISPEEIDQKVRSLPLNVEILMAESTRTGDHVVTTVRRLKWWLVPILVVVLGTLIYLGWQGQQQRQNSSHEVNDIVAQLVKAHEREVGDFRNREQDYQQQVRALTEAVTVLTKQKGFDIAEALAQLRENNTGAAETIFETILEHKVAEGRAAFQQAAEAARHLGALAFLHDTQKALAAYRRAVDLDPANMEGWNRLGQLLNRIGRLDEAIGAYNRVRALGAERGDQDALAMAYGNLGSVYLARGNLTQAEDMLRKALAHHEAVGQKKSIATGYGNLGIVYDMRGDLGRAEAMYRKSLSLNEALGEKEGIARDYQNLGNTYRARGDLEQAEAMYRKSLSFNEALGRKEGIASNYLGLGIVYDMRGDLEQAEAMYRKSLSFNEALGRKSGIAGCYHALGGLYLARGNQGQAEEMYRKALVLHEVLGDKGGIAASYNGLGNLYKTGGDLGRAEEMYRRALPLYEEVGNRGGIGAVYTNLGNVYKNRGDLRQAEDMHRKALAYHEAVGDKEVIAGDYHNLGNVYRLQGDLVKAGDMYRKALRLFREIGMATWVEVVQKSLHDTEEDTRRMERY